MLTRQEIEAREERLLAPYAMKSKNTRGRQYLEEEHPYRSVYQRDRDRIIHSTAFRRLEYKTQVFVNHEGDYYRTRLTHTLEVAQIGRSIARALNINEDLVEVIALAHDIGHPPFGHAGEFTLSEIMKDHGGFDHNLQGLRIVDYLEQRYPLFKGLNLTWEVREGINKHTTLFDKATRIPELEPDRSPTLEMQVVDLADEIAYDNHDLDDGLTSGLIFEEDLKEVPLWEELSIEVRKSYKDIVPEMRKFQIIRLLINRHISDLISQTEKNINEFNILSIEDVRRCKCRIVSFSSGMLKTRSSLRDFLYKNLYKHHRVIRMSDKANRFIKELFGVYLNNLEQLPNTTRGRLETEEAYRVICDYIAGMTDRYALEEYKKLFDPLEKV